MNTQLCLVLFVTFLAFASAGPPVIYNDWASFAARLPSNPLEIAFDNLSSLFNPPYLPFGAINWSPGFPTYAFSENGFSYVNTASGAATNNLGPCTPDGFSIYQEAYAAGSTGGDGTLYYTFTPPYPTLFGAQVCSTSNDDCEILSDSIAIVANGGVVEAALPSIRGAPGVCAFWGIEIDQGIQTLSFQGHQLQEFVGVANITLAVAVHSGGLTDPHFTGFQGEKYDFGGLGGNWYNIISSPRLQMNALFSSTCQGKLNNVMTAIAINSDGHKFFINNTREATLDGVPIPSFVPWNTPILVGNEGVSGKIVHPWANWFHIQTSELIITPTIHDHGNGDDFKGENCVESFFNFEADLLAKTTFMHGVLGQSAQHFHTANTDIKGWEGDVEGTDSDYIVSGPWGLTAKFNQYKGPQ